MSHHARCSAEVIHHVYSVPDAALFQIRALSQVSVEFGCGSKVRKADDLKLLSVLGSGEKHQQVVLHHRYDSQYGWQCWIPLENLPQLIGILQVFHLHSLLQPAEEQSAI